MSDSANTPRDHGRGERPGLRIGHAERDAVIEILRQAAGDGRITTEELDERIERAAHAKTFTDLDPIVADLPVPPPSQAAKGTPGLPGRPGVSLTARVPDAPGYSPQDPMTLDAVWDSDKRTGRWQTVPYIRLKTTAATAKLDFTQAQNELAEIFVEVQGKAGTAVLVLPEGWAVNVDRLSAGYGSKRVKVPAVPEPGAPLIVVTGAVGMGSFVARGPNYFERKRLNPP